MQVHPVDLPAQPPLQFLIFTGTGLPFRKHRGQGCPITSFVFVTYPWYSVKWFFNMVSSGSSIPMSFPQSLAAYGISSLLPEHNGLEFLQEEHRNRVAFYFASNREVEGIFFKGEAPAREIPWRALQESRDLRGHVSSAKATPESSTCSLVFCALQRVSRQAPVSGRSSSSTRSSSWPREASLREP
jgi:hypothetical protein